MLGSAYCVTTWKLKKELKATHEASRSKAKAIYQNRLTEHKNKLDEDHVPMFQELKEKFDELNGMHNLVLKNHENQMKALNANNRDMLNIKNSNDRLTSMNRRLMAEKKLKEDLNYLARLNETSDECKQLEKRLFMRWGILTWPKHS